MATPHMAALYQQLQRVFEARPTDLAKTGKLLTQLKVRHFESAAPRSPVNLLVISGFRLVW